MINLNGTEQDDEPHGGTPVIQSERLSLAQEVWIKSTTANGAVYRADLSSRSASREEQDGDAAPTALSESFARAARRIDRRRNTLRAHMATIDVVPASLATAAPARMTVVNVEGSTHGHVSRTSRQCAPSSTLSKDEGWDALLSVVQNQTRPSMPLPP